MQAFFDSEFPGIRIQVNATSLSQPGSSFTVSVSLTTQTNVDVDRFNLEIYGFINETVKISLTNVTDTNFNLNSDTRKHGAVVSVPEQVWGVIYGEIKISYSADIGGVQLTFPNLLSGFPMTVIENSYLISLETQLSSLKEANQQLNQNYSNLAQQLDQLNRTYLQLQGNYTSIQGNVGELDNTRRLTAVLGIVTVFFIATTAYLVIRKPRETW